MWIKNFFQDKNKPDFMALDFLKYIGPGFLVTVGFIDPETGLQILRLVQIMDISFYGW